MVQVHQRGRRGARKPLGGPITVRNVRGYFVARSESRRSRADLRFTAGEQRSLAVKPVTIFR